jgi:hypothetical protein
MLLMEVNGTRSHACTSSPSHFIVIIDGRNEINANDIQLNSGFLINFRRLLLLLFASSERSTGKQARGDQTDANIELIENDKSLTWYDRDRPTQTHTSQCGLRKFPLSDDTFQTRKHAAGHASCHDMIVISLHHFLIPSDLLLRTQRQQQQQQEHHDDLHFSQRDINKRLQCCRCQLMDAGRQLWHMSCKLIYGTAERLCAWSLPRRRRQFSGDTNDMSYCYCTLDIKLNLFVIHLKSSFSFLLINSCLPSPKSDFLLLLLLLWLVGIFFNFNFMQIEYFSRSFVPLPCVCVTMTIYFHFSLSASRLLVLDSKSLKNHSTSQSAIKSRFL